MNPFTAHPRSVGESYFQHLRFALRFGTRMTAGGLAAVMHSLFPFCFVTTASRISDEPASLSGVAPTHPGSSVGERMGAEPEM